MAEDLLKKYIDRSAFESDTAFGLAQLDKLSAAYDKLSKTRANVAGSGSLQTIATGAKEAQLQIDGLNDSLSNFTKTQTQAAAGSTQVAAAIKSESNSIAENIQKRRQLEESTKKLNAAQKEDYDLRKANTITQKEYTQRLNDTTAAIEKNKLRIADLNKEIKSQTAIQLGSVSAYKQFVQQVAAAEDKAKSLSKTFGANHPAAIQATADALALKTQLKDLDATTGTFNKNVGNYGNAFSKAYGGLRTIANILPGVGIGTIFGLAIDPLVAFASKLSEVNHQTKILTELQTSASESAGKELGALKESKAIIEDVNQKMSTRVKAIQTLKAEYPDYFASLSNEQLLTGQVAGAYDLATQAIIRKAKAEAASTAIASLSSKQLAIQLKGQEDYNETLKLLNNAQDKVTSSGGAGGGGAFAQTAAQQRKQILAYFAQRQSDRKKENDDLQTDLDFYIQFVKEGADVTVKGEKTKKTSQEKQLSALKSFNDTAYEISKLAQERLIAGFEKESKDTNTVYEARLIALDKYQKAYQALIDNQADFDVLSKQQDAVREIRDLNSKKAGQSPAEIARINANIKTIRNQLAADTALIDAKAADQSIKLIEKVRDEKNDIKNDESNADQKRMDEDAKNEDADSKARFKRLEETLKKQNDAEKKAAEDKLKIDKELQEKRAALAQASAKFIEALLTASIDRQKNALQEQSDEIDKAKERDLQANDARVQSEQDKAANIAIINARAQTQKDQIERKQRELDQKKAQYERAEAIASIIIQTAKAIAKDLAGNKAAIPLDIALGAVQLATVLATPLPKFKHGLDHDYEGYGITGDGGKRELIKRRDGSYEITPATDTLTKFEKGDRVIPDADAYIRAAHRSAIRDGRIHGTVTEDSYGKDMVAGLTHQIEGQTKVLKEIANKPTQSIHGTDKGLASIWMWGANQTKYLNDNTNWGT